MEQLEILSVSAFNRIVQSTLARHMSGEFRVSGQITGWMRASSGHIYFSIKDETDEIVRCIIWRSTWAVLSARFAGRQPNGLQVVCTGSVSFYARGGTVNLVVSRMEDSGMGLLWTRFLQIRAKLEAEGLFSPERKQALPPFPHKIALVTSPAGEVLKDVCKVAAHRNASIPIVLVPVPVQGAEAVPALVQGIRLAAAIPDVDVIILARGGGSMEDLWCFNDEQVARAIAACPLPVVTGIGHEPDVTIADFVADRRASTPSNAAEIVVPDAEQIRQRIFLLRKHLDHASERTVYSLEHSLLTLKSRFMKRSPEGYLNEILRSQEQLRHRLTLGMTGTLNQLQMRLLDDSNRLESGVSKTMQNLEKRFSTARMRLAVKSPETEVDRLARLTALLHLKIQSAAEKQWTKTDTAVKSLLSRLSSTNPERVLERGYAFVTSGKQVVTSSQNAPDSMTLHFRDGTLAVEKKKEDDVHAG